MAGQDAQQKVRKRQQAATTAQTREAAARQALGLPDIDRSLASLYGQLGKTEAQPGDRDGLDDKLLASISKANDAARAGAGFAGELRPTADAVFGGSAAGRLSQERRETKQSELSAGAPESNTLAATLLQSFGKLDKQNLDRGVLPGNDARGIAPTPYTGGGKQSNLDVQSLADRLMESLGGKVPNQAYANVFGALGEFKDKNQQRENFRDTLIANQNKAQRSVQSINQSVFTGRRKRGSAQSIIPKVAFAGLGSQSRTGL